jgi:hypothetical protein
MCFCDKDAYFDSVYFNEVWIWGHKGDWVMHQKLGDFGINKGSDLCDKVNVTTLPEIVKTIPDTCCFILKHCQRCTPDEEAKEKLNIEFIFIELVQQHGQKGGGVCHLYNWANSYPLKSIAWNIYASVYAALTFTIFNQGVPCGCMDWQETIHTGILQHLVAIKSKCWRVCKRDWSLFGVSPVHHWVTLESRHSTARYALDPWGGGNQMHAADEYESPYLNFGKIKEGICQAPGIYWP